MRSIETISSSQSLLFVPAPAADTANQPANDITVTSSFGVELMCGDLTKQACDAIVNPVGPGLVDLAVRSAAGPELLNAYHEAREELPTGRLARGQAVVTAGFGLPAKHVIHTVAPFYADDPANARALLASCYAQSLLLAASRGFGTVAFPALATGVLRYPLDEAADVALAAVAAHGRRGGAGPRRVRFVLRTPATLQAFVAAARRHLGGETGASAERFTFGVAARSDDRLPPSPSW